MSMNASLYKALVSGGLTYVGFSYALPQDPNKNYFTISSAVGSYLGDTLITNFFPTYTSAGSLVDTLFSSGTAAGSAYLVEKVMAGNSPDFQMDNMTTKFGILLLSNVVSDYITNMLYNYSSSSSTTVTGA